MDSVTQFINGLDLVHVLGFGTTVLPSLCIYFLILFTYTTPYKQLRIKIQDFLLLVVCFFLIEKSNCRLHVSILTNSVFEIVF